MSRQLVHLYEQSQTRSHQGEVWVNKHHLPVVGGDDEAVCASWFSSFIRLKDVSTDSVSLTSTHSSRSTVTALTYFLM